MNTSLTRRGGGMGKYWRFPKKSQSPSPPVVVALITFSTPTVLELLKREILSRLPACVWEGSCALLWQQAAAQAYVLSVASSQCLLPLLGCPKGLYVKKEHLRQAKG